jgi:hypothetical protein
VLTFRGFLRIPNLSELGGAWYNGFRFNNKFSLFLRSPLWQVLGATYGALAFVPTGFLSLAVPPTIVPLAPTFSGGKLPFGGSSFFWEFFLLSRKPFVVLVF